MFLSVYVSVLRLCEFGMCMDALCCFIVCVLICVWFVWNVCASVSICLHEYVCVHVFLSVCVCVN